MRTPTQEEIEILLKLLEADSAEIHNLPDDEFQSAYMAFRSRAEEFFQTLTPNGMWGAILSLTARGSMHIFNFIFNEGILRISQTNQILTEALPRNNETWSLDPGAALRFFT